MRVWRVLCCVLSEYEGWTGQGPAHVLRRVVHSIVNAMCVQCSCMLRAPRLCICLVRLSLSLFSFFFNIFSAHVHTCTCTCVHMRI